MPAPLRRGIFGEPTSPAAAQLHNHMCQSGVGGKLQGQSFVVVFDVGVVQAGFKPQEQPGPRFCPCKFAGPSRRARCSALVLPLFGFWCCRMESLEPHGAPDRRRLGSRFFLSRVLHGLRPAARARALPSVGAGLYVAMHASRPSVCGYPYRLPWCDCPLGCKAGTRSGPPARCMVARPYVGCAPRVSLLAEYCVRVHCYASAPRSGSLRRRVVKMPYCVGRCPCMTACAAIVMWTAFHYHCAQRASAYDCHGDSIISRSSGLPTYLPA